MPASAASREDGCVFCALEGSGRVLLTFHVADGLALHQPEWNAAVELLKQRREQLSAKDASISGWPGLLNARGAVITDARSGSIKKPAAHVLVKDTADQGLVGNALLQGTGTQGA
ncbi:MAG: hypothetical protein ACKOPS_14345 [Cyanobium sp.]